MQRVVKSVLAGVLMAALAGNALADGGRGRDHWRPREYRSGGDWIAPLIFVGIAGAMLGAAAAQPSPQPQGMPPMQVVPPAPPANAQYYCRSVGQYYPYTLQGLPEQSSRSVWFSLKTFS